MLALPIRALPALVLSSFVPSALTQTTWYVDAGATPPGSGTQGSPYTSIQYALSQSTTLSGDTVLVLPGTYAENVDFLGKAVRLVSSGGRTVTTIDGGGSTTYISTITFANGEGPGSVLQGFTVTNGIGTYDPGLNVSQGGGVRISGASPTIRDCLITANEAEAGGNLFSDGGSPRIEGCTLSYNLSPFSGWAGGGARFEGGSPWLVDTLIWGNGAPCFGGGLYFEDSLPTLLRTVVRDNYSTYCEGGGVYLCHALWRASSTVLSSVTSATTGGTQEAVWRHSPRRSR
jgi:hypothetical protein